MRRILSVIASCAFVVSCAVNGNPYVNTTTPDGRETIFRYGNFCGPSLPDGLSSYDYPSEKRARIGLIKGLEPVDTVDALCKAHDLCYEINGHDDSMCDKAFMDTLETIRLRQRLSRNMRSWDRSGERYPPAVRKYLKEHGPITFRNRNGSKCGRLLDHMMMAFNLKFSSEGEHPLSKANRYTYGALVSPLIALYYSEETDESDYPEPGQCKDPDLDVMGQFPYTLYRVACLKDDNFIITKASQTPHKCNSFPPDFTSSIGEDSTHNLRVKWLKNMCLDRFMSPVPNIRKKRFSELIRNRPDCDRYISVDSGGSVFINEKYLRDLQ